MNTHDRALALLQTGLENGLMAPKGDNLTEQAKGLGEAFSALVKAMDDGIREAQGRPSQARSPLT